MKSNIHIDIASEFTGRKAFQDASKATTGLEKAVGKLGKQLAGAFSVYKVAQFAKASTKAFMEDQQAAKVLANQLRNIGYGSAAAGAEQFISAMEKTTGVMDDKLRPAYGQLIRVTGSLSETQKLLNTAWNVSAGTGQDIATVVDALSKAYVGNTKGLKSLNTGLTNAELTTKSFSQIVDLLNQQFAGAGQASINTYAGQVAILSVAVQNAMETIGSSFIDAFKIINGDQGLGGTVNAIENASNKMGDFIRQTAAAVGILKEFLNPKNYLSPSRGEKNVRKILDQYRFEQGLAEQKRMFKEWVPTEPWTADQKKAAAAAAARAKELAALIKKQAAAQAELVKKKQDALKLDELSKKYKQAESIFNMEQIELAAASMAKQTAEDYARIKLKQDLIALQDAIQAGDLKAAEAAAKVVEEDYKRVWAYQAQNIALGIQQGTIVNIQNAAKLIPTDIGLINLDNLKSALDYINQMLAKMTALQNTATKPSTAAAAAAASSAVTDYSKANYSTNTSTLTGIALASALPRVDTSTLEGIAAASGTSLASLISPYGSSMSGIDTSSLAGISKASTAPVVVNITDNASKLVDVIMDTTQQQSANGVSTRIVRNTGNLAW